MSRCLLISPSSDGWRSSIPFFAAVMLILTAGLAQAQLRIVTYNTTGAPRTGMDIILKSIGEETRNGIAKPIDVLLLGEQSLPSGGAGDNNPSPSTQQFVTLLNNIYNNAGITYAMSNGTGAGDTTQTIVYRTQTIQTIQTADGISIASAAPRDTLRFRVRPVGYSTSGADLYIYNSHYKASLDASPPGTNANERLDEATQNRANSDALGQGASAIYAGDHNFYYADSREPAWGKLTSAGNGQANDPLNRVGNWHINSSFADVHTQSPCVSSSAGCGASGGMDDRFDFELVTGELLDGEGLSYLGPTSSGLSGLTHSYHAFGNNGSTYNTDINSASNTVTFPGVTSYTKSQILNALWSVTDHLPVVADYQVPAIMQAVTGTIPSSIDLGSPASLNVTVSNAANVVAALGADELDYSLTSSGNVVGAFLNQIDAALGGGNVHSLTLNTASIGMKTGTISITSSSQGVENGATNIPITYLVVLPGDYNGDGTVDAGDYVVWRKNSGLTGGASYAKGDGDRDGNVTTSDYTIWRSHFGQTATGAGSAAELASAVPEPSSLALLVIGICLLGRRPTRLKAWTRQS
jgi:hypothetical protein